MTKQTKKYKFTKETLQFFGRTLHRIVATRDFGTVKKGDLGGFIETEANLSHEGNCWVSGDAWVCGNARVSGKAQVYGDALVSGDAWVSGNAMVYGGAQVCGNARVSGKAQVYGDALVCGEAEIKDQTQLTEGNHSGEVIKEPQTNLTEEVAKLRQENEELKAKLENRLNNYPKYIFLEHGDTVFKQDEFFCGDGYWMPALQYNFPCTEPGIYRRKIS